MSELDIEMQKQTADVSIIEMMQVADNMQVKLGCITPKTEQISIGEDSDGK